VLVGKKTRALHQNRLYREFAGVVAQTGRNTHTLNVKPITVRLSGEFHVMLSNSLATS